MALRFRSTTVLAVIGVILAALLVGVFIGTRVFAQSDKVCRGVVVSGVDLSGMTSIQAQESLRSAAKKKMSETLVLRAGGKNWTGTLAGLGVVLKWQDAAHQAWLVGRGGGLVQQSRDFLGLGAVTNLDIPIAIDPSKLNVTLKKAAQAVDRPHRDASVQIVSGAFTIKPDQDGYKLDMEAARAAVKQAVVTGTSTADLPIIVDKASITTADLRSINGVLAEYTTKFRPSQRDRTKNLKLAAVAMNGFILKPGEKFSYNAVVGPRVTERGYRNAPIFVKGRIEPGLGGGICQVSSTLYNTVLLAGLKVNERHHHSRTVVYTPAGRDATVAYGSRDFKFTNTLSNPIYIGAGVQGSTLRVAIYGSLEDRLVVKVWSSRSGYGKARAAVSVEDKTLKPGKSKVVDKGSGGVAAVVRRSITRGGKTVTEVVSRDIYPAQPRVIAVGPKPASNPAPPPPSVAGIELDPASRPE